MYRSTSAYLNYIIVLSGTCPYICNLCSKTSLTCFNWIHIKPHVVESVHVAVMCVMKLLVCKFNWTGIITFIVINVHTSEVSAINHLLSTVNWIQWLVNISILHISGICVLKISVCCRCVINILNLGCCIASSVVCKVVIIGHHYATLSFCET